MATTYAAYSNIMHAHKSSMEASTRRTSASSDSNETKQKSKLRKFLDQLKPTEESITPEGIYSPIIKRGPLFEGLKPIDEPQTPSGIYTPIINQGELFHKRGSKSSSHKSHSAVSSRKSSAWKVV